MLVLSFCNEIIRSLYKSSSSDPPEEAYSIVEINHWNETVREITVISPKLSPHLYRLDKSSHTHTSRQALS